MNINHVILTDKTFRAPNWAQSLDNLSILQFSGGAPYAFPGKKENCMIWIVTSVPGWSELVRHYSQDSSVIVLSKLLSLAELQQAFEAGARGYMEAVTNPIQMRQAADTISKGALWVAAPMMSRLLQILSGALPSSQTPSIWKEKLTPRELQVAETVASGVSNREAAERLHITVRTVKEHLSSIFSKLEINDRLQLILRARGGK